VDGQSGQLVRLIADMQEEDAVKLAQGMLDSGYDPINLLGHGREAMELVGKHYAEGDACGSARFRHDHPNTVEWTFECCRTKTSCCLH
jgi:methanogenic corrinoid protein MtbC1